MPTPFPGMDPYLEQFGIWNQVQIDLIVQTQRYLAGLLRPKKIVAIGMRTRFPGDKRKEEKQRYLEVRDQVSGEAITVIEILSPTNKRSHRREYLEKRLEILGSETNLVEIDLLRAGAPMPMTGKTPDTHYRILISRAWERPYAEALLFNIPQPIPDVPIPLRQGEEEAIVPLNRLLHEIYDEGGYDLMLNYSRPPDNPLDSATAAWAAKLLAGSEV